ncbi:MAG: MATE family efflux transporter [Firmicutes bacterium]|nr:MATE family efflux transporter [Bacillota bacterium]
MSREDTRRYLILKDPNIYKGLIFLALPVMLNNFIKTIHDIVDMYFVSKIADHSADAVSSISITFPVLFMFISIGIGLGIAGTALISQFVGSNLREDAKRYATNLFIISVFVGLLLNIIAFFGAPFIMELMGASGFLLENSVSYLQIRSFELTAVFIFFAFTSIKQADGDTLTPMYYGVVTIILNIILSPILISVLNLGVQGAAYATLIANVVILPFVLYQLFFSKNGLTISIINRGYNLKVVTEIVNTAVPASTGQALTAVGFIIMNAIIISYGTETLAAFSVGNRLSSLILHPVMAIGTVLAAYIGQNIGNLNVSRAKESVRKGMILSVSVMVVLSFIALFLREPMISLFLEDDPVSFNLAVRYMFFLIIGLPLMAIFQTFVGTYNGAGRTNYTFIVGVTRLFILRIPLIFVFKYLTDMGSSGIWTAMLISNFIIAFIGYAFYTKLDFTPKIDIQG